MKQLYKSRLSTRRGFTLIELLIVIAIIGILSSVVLVSLSGARVKARTAKSVEQLQSVNEALGVYFSGNGRFPVSNEWQGFCSAWGADLGANWIPELGSALPTDPRQDPNTGCVNDTNQYIYYSNGIDYKLISHSPESMDVSSNLVDPVRPSWAFGYWTPGAASW